MTEFNDYKLLTDMVIDLKSLNIISTNRVSNIRTLIRQLNDIKTKILNDGFNPTLQEMTNYQAAVDNAIAGKDIVNLEIETNASIEMFQLGASTDNVNLEFEENSIKAPERGTIIQKLWKVQFIDDTFGHAIVSDTSDPDLSALLNGQISTALSTAPNGAVEDLGFTILLSDLEEIILTNSSQDLTELFNNLEKPGLIARQLRDIDIDNDISLQSLDNTQKINIKSAIDVLNLATTVEDINNAQSALQTVAEAAGLYSTSIGPLANLNYSDLKRFNLQKDENTIVSVTMSMPVISWGESVPGIPLRDSEGPKNKSNRKDNGTSYIVDLGGIDPVIRQGRPNPLPPTRYYNNGPIDATETEGALDRYAGGKCVGINTTDESAFIQTLHREKDGIITLTIPPMSGIWKLDRATFDGGNKHAYYTVFSASKSPASGYMGVVLAPKQNRLGRGRGEIASGVTAANGVSKTGKTFNLQDSNGAILNNGNEVPSNLKGLTSDLGDGHGMDPADLLKFMQDNEFVKGTQYLTIPANATINTIEDILIPAGEFVPQITQAIGTLMQFGGGKFIQDGGPARFQPGLIPFLPGTIAYTPEWHINWIFYNCGSVECEGNVYPITNVAQDDTPGSWIRPNFNPSFGPPGPNLTNSKESRYNPLFPDTFDPIQLRCDIKKAYCREYIDKIEGSIDGEITLFMLPALENDNNIFFTEAPGGALRGWVKFLVVNCPLPVIATINVIGQQETINTVPSQSTNGNCVTCTCDRAATLVSINGNLNPIWLEEDDEGNDGVIGTRILKFKVGDNIVIRSTSGTVHGVSLRMDNMQSNTTFDNSKTLEVIQNEVLTEIKDMLTINNEQDLENNIIALTNDVITFHSGIPITFTQKATTNPINFPDGVAIADFTIKESAEDMSGSVSCTVHGVSMSFKFEICPLV
jgi:hypothetical protein